MSSPVDQIRQKLDLVDFIGQYVTLKKAGRNYKACCPFHQEKSPSFVVSPERQIWHCFGSCGTGGDIIGFWMKRENLTFREALKDLADKAGVELEQNDYSDDEHKRKEDILMINTLAAKYYSYVLSHTTQGQEAHAYLINRGLRPQIIETFQIGFAPDSWDSLIRFFGKKSIQSDRLIAAGLAISRENSSRAYDRFRNRIVFPIRDIRGNIVGFSGRVLDGGLQGAKYVNTPETAVYHKRESLYGINVTKDAIRKEDNVFIVEGEFDLISPYQHGVSNVVAIKGSALTNEQLDILKRLTSRITLALDTDEAGIAAMKRGIREAEKKDFEIHVAQFRNGKDPDEAVRKDPVAFKEDLLASLPIYDFLLGYFKKKYPDPSPFQKKKIAEEMAPFLIHIVNPIVSSHYQKKIAEMLDVEVSSVEKLLRLARFKEQGSFYTKKSIGSKMTREEMTQRYVMSLMLQSDESLRTMRLSRILEADNFTAPYLHLLFIEIKKYLDIHQLFDYQSFVKDLKPEIRATADEIFLYATSMPDVSDDTIVQLLYDVKRYGYQYHISKLSQQEANGDEAVLTSYLGRLKALSKNEIAKQWQTM